MWTVVLLASAGVGAFVASRSDPFPPGVEDPGVRPSSTDASTSPTLDPALVRWELTVESRTRHDLHVGGSCHSEWQVQALLTELPTGTVAGEGLATLQEPATCDFPNAQIQAGTIEIRVSGFRREGSMQLEMKEAGRDPIGGRDLGGFANTLGDMTFVFEGLGARATDVVVVERPDGDLGTYVSASRARLRCDEGC